MFFLKNIDYNTDEGWILESLKTEIKYTVDSALTTLVPYSKTNTIFSHMFVNSNWRDLYKRSYLNIQGVFAYTGGFVSLSKNILGIICEFLAYPDILKLFSDKYFPKKENSTNKIINLSVNNALKIVTVTPLRKKDLIS
jgi:hypothetical protein